MTRRDLDTQQGGVPGRGTETGERRAHQSRRHTEWVLVGPEMQEAAGTSGLQSRFEGSGGIA